MKIWLQYQETPINYTETVITIITVNIFPITTLYLMYPGFAEVRVQIYMNESW